MSETPAKPKKKSGLFLAVVVVLIAALAVEGYLLLKPRPAKETAAKRPIEAQAAIVSSTFSGQKIEEFGDSNAPIKVELYAPLVLEWHQKTIGLLREYDKKHPGKIHVKLMPMGKSECDEEMAKRGYTCAVLFVNGKVDYTLPDGKKVEFYQWPNHPNSTYNSEDVITVIDELVKKGK
jgi:hypothetical protein